MNVFQGMNMPKIRYNETRKVVIKRCIDCGHTQRLPYRIFTCPSCQGGNLFFHESIYHLKRYVEFYGLRNMRFIDENIQSIFSMENISKQA